VKRIGILDLLDNIKRWRIARSLANKYLTHNDSVDDFLRWRKEEATAEEDKMNRSFEPK
jgi:hypothetical protein